MMRQQQYYLSVWAYECAKCGEYFFGKKALKAHKEAVHAL